MRLAILPLSVACLATLFLPVANMAPLKVLSAPNLLRIGATENIFVQCHGCKDVTIIVYNFPSKTTTLATTRVELNLQNNYQALGAIKISASDFRNDPELKQYVWLEAKFSDVTKLSKVVMVTFQSGYIFIQTDKPLYTPNSEVHYRVFALTPAMEPINDKYPTDAIITVNFMVLVENPDGSPAPDVPIVVTPSDFETTTSKTGIAMVSVDPTANSLTLSITIQSKGQLVQQGYNNIVGLTSVVLMLRIKKEMLPSFRIIAYYEVSEEVVADSVWVDVTDTCMGSLEVKEENYPSFTPHQRFTYRITGDPGATVGLVAVDKGVYALNNKHHLTQKKADSPSFL
ncbi:hypothetical protein NHX12_000209 [Muraenolepis orangiensis]|uniref:Alpha-2-macroglobulin bait region domain-containing protein n=1 Tax=Muraenolepis orangiensis TaxID=630683 RepID=A0A9Q0I2Q2_9TELE|nr:hypothetical protein NHX12_000209 [Muraenolepis orangiensis]